MSAIRREAALQHGQLSPGGTGLERDARQHDSSDGRGFFGERERNGRNGGEIYITPSVYNLDSMYEE